MSSIFKFLFFLIVLPLFSFSQELNIYPFPAKGFDHGSTIYNVVVKQGLTKKESYVYVSRAGTDMSQKEWGFQQGKSFHYTIFSFSGTVAIEVTKNNSLAETATIRPSAAGIGTIATTSKRDTRSVSFVLKHPGKFSIEFDDDPFNKEALMLFADGPEKTKDVPDVASSAVWKVGTDDKNIIVPANKSIVYFAPGIYEPGYFELPKQVKQVYIAGGAFVRGYIFASRKADEAIQINGRGILSNDRWPYHYPVNTASENYPDYLKWYWMIKINGGSHHHIEGITFVDPSSVMIAIYSSRHSIVENIKVNAFRYNNTAINLHGDYNTIDQCFFRSNEDVISVNDNNTTIKNCEFWQLHNGSMIQLGWTPHNIGGNNIIENCTILHAEWDYDHNIGFINVMNESPPETPSVIENFSIKNICADTEILRFADLRMVRNGKGQPLIIRNLSFENIYLKRNKLNVPLFYFTGYDAAHTISNISFSNLSINDKFIDDSSQKSAGLFKVDKFAETPVFKN